MTAEYEAFENRIKRAGSNVNLDKIADHVAASTLSGKDRTALHFSIARRRKALYESGEVQAEQVRDEFLHDEKTRGDGRYDDCGCDYPDWHSQGGEDARDEKASLPGADLSSKASSAAKAPPPTPEYEYDYEKDANERYKDEQFPPYKSGENMNEAKTGDAKAGTITTQEQSIEGLKDAAGMVKAQLQQERGLVPQSAAEDARMISFEDAEKMISAYKQFERIKKELLTLDKHYVMIEKGGKKVPHINREGALVLAARFSVHTPRPERELTLDKDGNLIRAEYRQSAIWAGREVTMTGACDMNELKGDKTYHNCVTKAETRAFKRAVLTVLGSADPIADE